MSITGYTVLRNRLSDASLDELAVHFPGEEHVEGAEVNDDGSFSVVFKRAVRASASRSGTPLPGGLEFERTIKGRVSSDGVELAGVSATFGMSVSVLKVSSAADRRLSVSVKKGWLPSVTATVNVQEIVLAWETRV